jgi:hypothetical protein
MKINKEEMDRKKKKKIVRRLFCTLRHTLFIPKVQTVSRLVFALP